jgi:hypothetical protein
MIELLAIPAWKTPPTTLAAWVEALGVRGGPTVVVERDAPEGAWVHLEPLGVHGFAVLAGPHVESVNFEIQEPLTDEVRAMLEEAAAAIGWEIHDDDDDDDDD